MKVALDATPLTLSSGGLPRYVSELSLALAREFPGGDYELWAYGDSAGDRELLAMADHPTLLTRRMEKSLALPSSAGRRI